MGRLLVRAAVGLGAVVVVGGLAVLGIVLFGRPAVALGRSPTALASVDVGGLGAQVTSVRAVAHGTAVPVTIRDGGVWPLRRLPPGKRVALIVQVAAPGWLQWLVGSSVAMHTQVSTPFPAPTTAVGLVTSERQLRVRFDVPVTEVRYREAGGPAHTIHLASATALVAIPVPLSGYAGTVALAAAADPWERTASRSQTVAWFVPPVRGRPAAVVSPAPGATGTSADSALTITFSEPVAEVLGGRWPTLSPSAPGRWSEPTAYTVRFTPRGMGFGPDTTVVVGFEREVSLVTSPTTLVTGSSYRFTEGPGSILRLQQLLAQIGYLPVTFTPAAGTAEPSTLAAEEATVDRSLPGSFHWRWSGLPSALT